MFIRLLFQDPLIFVLVAVALVICLTLHEFAHAYSAHKLGDDTAKNLGRMTLDPRSHLDPLGTILILLVGFGWGRPVPFNPYNLKNPKRDSAIIALAGPVANFVLAGVLALIFHLVTYTSVPALEMLQMFLYFTIMYNLILGIFNLIPVHPLDGFKVVNGLLPPALSIQWMQLAPYGIYILLFLIVIDGTSMVVNPLLALFMGFLGLPFGQ